MSCKLLKSHVLSDSIHVSIYHTVRLSFSAFATESAVEKACVHKHFPDYWIAPIVANWLWNNFDMEIVMPSFQISGRSVLEIPTDANHVFAQALKRIVKGIFVVNSFAFSIRNDTFRVACPDEHTPMIHSVKTSDVCHTIWIDKDKCEIWGLEDLIMFRFKVSLWTCSLEIPRFLTFFIKLHVVNLALISAMPIVKSSPLFSH